ncbi:MAG TPA: peptide ABC transporter substrate-binding protein [Thermomicrobiaceae bacterium]|nr:peptide ABC transporter substrate-binding protein [Thermomicrobiaceae bacterium]
MNSSRWSRRAAVILLLSLLVLVLSACRRSITQTTPSASPAPIGTATPGAEAATIKPQKGGSLVAAIPEQPDSLNFSLAYQVTAFWVLSALDARMIRFRQDGTYDPQLLAEVPSTENGGVSDDGRTWTLHFRPKLSWSDGEPLDARDFKFTWATMTDRAYPAVDRSGWSSIAGIRLSGDDLTAVLSLRQPNAGLLDQILAGRSDDRRGFLLPAHILDSVPPSQIPDSGYGAAGHVGSGPFKLAKWTPGEQVVVERNDHFFGTPALLDRIVYRIVPDSRVRLGSLDSGEIDLAPGLPETSLNVLNQLSGVQVSLLPMSGAVDLLAFNLDDPTNLGSVNPVLSDPVVRQSVELAFNRQRAAAEISPNAPVVETPLAYTRWADTALPTVSYDPARAAALLDADGWVIQANGVRAKNGVRLAFSNTTISGTDPEATVRQAIQQRLVKDLAAVGIEVVPRNLAPDEFSVALAKRQFESADLWNDARSDLVDFRLRFSSGAQGGGNVMGYYSLVVDQALSAAASAEDQDRRQQLLNTAQQQIHQDIPVIPIFAHLQVDAGRAYVQGLQPGSIAGLWWNVEDWWLNRAQTTP